MIKTVADQWAHALGGQLLKESDDIEVYSYGLEIILGAIVKAVILVSLSSLLGIFRPTFFCAISYISIRHFSGGVHLSTYYRCLMVGTIMLLLLGKIAAFASNSINFIMAIAVVIISGIYCIHRWVPAKRNRSSFSQESIRLQKKKAYIALFINALGIIVLQKLNLFTFSFASLLGVSAGIFYITPLGFSFINKIDYYINRLKGGLKYAK